jgi:hypothetical protein
MSLADAMKNFPAEMDTGKVTFIDGDAAGKSVQELAGMTNTSKESEAAAEKEMTSTSTVGDTQSAYEKVHGKIDTNKHDAGAKATVVIELSEAAKEHFKQPPPVTVTLPPNTLYPQSPQASAAANGVPLDPSKGNTNRSNPSPLPGGGN